MNNNNDSGNPFAGVFEEGEHILWQGKPDAEAYFKRRMKKLYILGVLQIAIGIVITGALYVLWQAKNQEPMPWGLMLLCIGMPVLGSFVYVFVLRIPIRKNSQTARYALTVRRVLCFDGNALSEKPIEDLPVVELKMHDEIEGLGSIKFGKPSDSATPGEGILFDTIPDAQRVYDMIVEARQKAQARQ